MAASRALKPNTKPKTQKQALHDSSNDSRESSPSILDTAEGGNVNYDYDSENDLEVSTSEEFSSEVSGLENGDRIKSKISTVSFGSLAKAQDAMDTGEIGASRKRKRGDEKSEEAEEKLEALRKRLRELREAKASFKDLEKASDSRKSTASNEKNKKSVRDASGPSEEGGEEADSNSADSDEDATTKNGRSSKHAPSSMSSKKAVTRRRTVVPMAKSTVRDPRFDPLAGPLNTSDVSKKYSFLEAYRASEMSTLQALIKNRKTPLEEQEAAKRQLLSMQSKQKAQKREEQEQKVLREHRKKEKDMIAQGKKPFYLKKSEQKKQALVERFDGMKARERDKVIERRRKKLTAKERKSMPDARRA